jgi:intracellular multiplication protein IcmL
MQNDKDASDYQKTRYDFYRRCVEWLGPICLVLSLATAADAVKDVYAIMHPAEPVVFGMMPDGQLQKAVVLSEPIIDDIAMKAWVEKAVLQTCNLNYMDWENQLNTAADNLLPAAVNGLKAEMDAKNIIKELKYDRLLEWCSAGGASWIVQKSLINNALYYEVKMPLLVRFMGQNEGRDHSSRQMMRVVVLQVPRSVKPRGFGIASIQAEPERTPIDGAQ